MSFFNFFKPQKTANHILYETISDLIKLLERKKELVEMGVLIDLSFDSFTHDKFLVSSQIKNKVFSLFGEQFENDLLFVFSNPELNKELILKIYDHLKNEQLKLSKVL
jgi:hypothetical protein